MPVETDRPDKRKILRENAADARFFERKKAVENLCANIPSRVLKERKFASQRVLHHRERWHLSLEAQSMAYCLLNSQSVPPDVAENTIQQAVTLGSMSGSEVDARTFELLFHAVSLNPSFELPFAFSSPLIFSNPWVC